MWRVLLACGALILGGCTTIPGRDAPRPFSTPPAHPPNPELYQPFAAAERTHPSESGFRMYSKGIDGLLLRLELIRAAHSTLDLQYYIFHGDESGRLVTEALADAARRGVRVRILVDDGETEKGDEQLFALAGHENVEIRVFNPWRYRGHNTFLRGSEYLLGHSRLDYRMHNKLFVVDDTIALIGGRNIGDQYFQIDPQSQFADDDVFVTGPAVPELAYTFERFWNSHLAIPAKALLPHESTSVHAAERLAERATTPLKSSSAADDFQAQLDANQPLAAVLAGAARLSWAHGEVASDSPDKGKKIAEGERVSGLLYAPVAQAIRDTHSEFIIVTPYLVPTEGELKLLQERHAAHTRVRILTTSLEATNDALAQAGYMHYRIPVLESGVELHELRASPESPRGTGQSARLSRLGNYSLHAKLLVFDRSGLYVGSMNYDQRSRRLNTENGMIIHSPELAVETARRFAALTQPQNAYTVTLQPDHPGDPPRLEWSAVKDGQPLVLKSEPARSDWQKFEVDFLKLFHIDSEL
jgi:putative cardiolipin synthase